MSWFALKNGERLFYEETGAGDRTVVMVHGWASTRKVFAPVLPAVSRAARCVTYDQRGHGNSRQANREKVTMDTLADDLDALIRGLGLGGVTLLGWSMGAGVVMDYVSRRGCGALRQLVLCDMTPRQRNDEDWNLGLYQGRFTKVLSEKEARESFFSLYREFAVNAVPRLSRIPGFLLGLPLKLKLSAYDEEVLISLALSMLEKDLRPCVERITVPVHYFYAEPGSLFSPGLAGWYREHIRTPFRSVGFPDSTHMLIYEHPRQFAREVIRALDC